MNTAATTGRVRFRNEALKVAEVAYSIRDSLLEAKGVLQVEVNKRIGSLLVLYDRGKTSAEQVMGKIATTLGIDVEKVKNRARNAGKALKSAKGRRYVKRGMMASLGGALAALTVSENWHVVGGSVFLGFLTLHLYQNQRTLAK
ncbi:HMA2 domain-containing protein [Desulfohalovibrio reitneri]|uniref:HMA2 domain-containing protein n=1 Tax=Desulfohalovibrio reitneri TaxID=1307759 RepID=UPI0004A6DB2C|nr:hypothetical protein [Desulfohalovibrio reitneri]